MKLRIFDNYLRLRLSQNDVETFQKDGNVCGQTNFANATFHYSLELSDKEEDVSASLEDNHIRVLVSSSIVESWLPPEEVGFSNRDQSQLKILVEKDFQCLHKRPGEDESNNFPNPLAKEINE